MAPSKLGDPTKDALVEKWRKECDKLWKRKNKTAFEVLSSQGPPLELADYAVCKNLSTEVLAFAYRVICRRLSISYHPQSWVRLGQIFEWHSAHLRQDTAGPNGHRKKRP